ncbi:MAG: protein kinase domain-containing protein [Gaiellaceae bacterium]
MVGELIAGRYELEELVGSGGMATVYRAHDRLLERPVALKILHEQFSSDAEALERFGREARAVAQLAHPNIVTVIDRGEDAGRPYIVFEYVGGENLKQLVAREGPLPVPTVIELGLQVARALEAAHGRGVVHRDVKPQNVLLADEGRAKVTDFGIAHTRGTEGMTLTGTIMGTSDYIPPEQARGEAAGEPGDVYSLGVVLFELLTGRLPYEADNAVAVAMRHVNDPVPSVRELRPDVPPRLDALVRRALAKEPRDRFASMSDLVAELEACGRGDVAPPSDGAPTMIVPPPPGREERRRRGKGRGRRVARALVLTLIVLLLVAGAALGAYVLASGLSDDDGGGGASAGTVVPLRGITAYDPQGDNKAEHDEEAPNATDRNPATYWKTETYNTFTKDGVGLVLDAGTRRQVRAVTVTTDTPGYTAELQTGRSPTGPFTPVAPGKPLGDSTTFTLQDADARYYVVWITDLGGRDVVHVNEVRARG